MPQGLDFATQGYLLGQDVLLMFQVPGSEFLVVSAPHVLSSPPSASISVLRSPLQASKGLKITGDVSGKLLDLGTL